MASDVTTAFIGITGTAVGAMIGFAGQWIVQRGNREAERERDRLNDARRLRDVKRDRLRTLYGAVLDTLAEMNRIYSMGQRAKTEADFTKIDQLLNDVVKRESDLYASLTIEGDRSKAIHDRLFQAEASLESVIFVRKTRSQGDNPFSPQEFIEARKGIVTATDELIELIRAHLIELESTDLSQFLQDDES